MADPERIFALTGDAVALFKLNDAEPKLGSPRSSDDRSPDAMPV